MYQEQTSETAHPHLAGKAIPSQPPPGLVRASWRMSLACEPWFSSHLPANYLAEDREGWSRWRKHYAHHCGTDGGKRAIRHSLAGPLDVVWGTMDPTNPPVEQLLSGLEGKAFRYTGGC